VDDKGLLRLGVVGAVVAAICCFTPLVVTLLAAIGLSVLTGWLDFVLLPALAIFAAVAVYGGVRVSRQRSPSIGDETKRVS
jgi:mercuric ion transport protein